MLELLAIEGPDGSGKSTLCRARFPEAKHAGGPPISREDGLARISGTTHGCFDRWFPISEIVYCKFRSSPFTQDELFELVYRYKPFIIYCRPPLLNLKVQLITQELKEHKTQEQIDHIVKHHKEIIQQYDEVMWRLTRNGIFVAPYDYTKAKL